MATEIIVAFLSGSSFIALINLFKWWITWKDKNRRGSIPNVLGRIHEVYHTLNVILKESGAHRVLISRSENGGAVPTVGKDIYTTVVYEVFDRELGSIKQFWQKQPLDEQYIQMLSQLVEEGHVTVITEKMAPSYKKDMYENDGVVRGEIYKIKTKPGQLYYLSAHFKDMEAVKEQSFRNLMRHSVQELAKLID